MNIHESVDCHEEGYLLYGEEQTTYSKQQIELCKKLKNRVKKFLEINQLSRTEGRPIGLETSTGLDLVLNKNFGCDREDAIDMLKSGRKLWYWNGADRSTEAYELMRKAYELLGRPELIRILDVHYHDRSLPRVDLVRR